MNSPNSSLKSSKDYVAVDIARLFFAYGIIGIHNGLLGEYIWGHYLRAVVFRLGVPFFFLCSGYFLAPKVNVESKRKALILFCKRLLPSYLILNMFYIPLVQIRGGFFSMASFWDGLWYMLTGRSMTVMWFVGALFWCALFLYLFYDGNKNKFEWVIVCFGALYLIGMLFNTHCYVLQGTISEFIYTWLRNIFRSNSSALFCGFFFFSIGFYINKYGIPKFVSQTKTQINFVLWGIIGSIGEFYIIRKHLDIVENYEYFISHILFVPALFLLLLNWKCRTNFSSKPIRELSSYIYYFHLAVLYAVIDLTSGSSWKIFQGTISPWLITAVVTTFCAIGYMKTRTLLNKQFENVKCFVNDYLICRKANIIREGAFVWFKRAVFLSVGIVLSSSICTQLNLSQGQLLFLFLLIVFVTLHDKITFTAKEVWESGVLAVLCTIMCSLHIIRTSGTTPNIETIIEGILFLFLVIHGIMNYYVDVYNCVRRISPLGYSIVIVIIETLFIYTIVNPNSMTDDRMISELISGAYGLSTSYTAYVNYILCFVLMHIQKVLPFINIYGLFLVLCVGVSLVVFLYLIQCRFPQYIGRKIVIYLSLLVIPELFIGIQYTQAAAMLTIAGFLLIFHCVYYKGKNWLWCILFGIVMCVLGFHVRYMAALMILPFAFLQGLKCLVGCIQQDKEKGISFSRSKTNSHSLKTKNSSTFLLIAAVSCVFALFAASYGIDAWRYAEKLPEFRPYNTLRTQINDYPYKKYDEYQDEYLSRGFSKIDKQMLDSWALNDFQVFSLEKMESYTEMAEEKDLNLQSIWGKMYSTFSGRSLLVFLYIALVAGLLFFNSYGKLFCLYQIVILFISGFFLTYNQRFPYWVANALLITSIMAMLCCDSFKKVKIEYDEKKSKDFGSNIFAKKHIIRATSIILFFIICLSVPNGITNLCMSLTESIQGIQWKNMNIQDTPRSEYLIQTTSQKDKVFVYFDSLDGNTSQYFREPHQLEPVGDMGWDNILSVGGWNTNLPPFINTMNKYDIENPIGDLVKSNAYGLLHTLSAANFVNDFLAEHYGDSISYSLQQTESDRLVVKYCQNLILPEHVSPLEATYQSSQRFMFKDEPFWAICFSISQSYNHIHLNLDGSNNHHTYLSAENEYLSSFGIDFDVTDCYFLIPEKDLIEDTSFSLTLFSREDEKIICRSEAFSMPNGWPLHTK